MTENALKGKYNGGSVPLGYVVNDEQFFAIDTLTAPIVREVYQRYADGETMKQLTEWLYERGVRSRKGTPVKLDAVKHMLKNRRYIGEYQYRDIVEPNVIPRIIDDALFQHVQERMNKNSKAHARFKAKEAGGYLLTTKLFCGHCGAYMAGESGTSRNGSTYHYYKCVSAKHKRGCKKKSVRKDWIENLVIEQTMHMLMDDAVMTRIVDMVFDLQTRENTVLPLLQKQLRETEKGINNMLDAIQSGVFTSSTKERLEALEQEKSELEVKIIQEEISEPILTKEQILFWLHRFRGIDRENIRQKQQLIDAFVNAVYLYDDKILLTFNYKDGTKQVTFEEVQCSDLEALGAPLPLQI